MNEKTESYKFATVLKAIVTEKGTDILLSPYLVNILSDYQAIQNQPAMKNIIKMLQAQGYINKLISTNLWEIDSTSICSRFTNENGFKEYLVSYIIKSLGYAMSKEVSVPCLFHEYSNQETYIGRSTNMTSGHIGNSSTTINIKEPFTRYNFPSCPLLTNHDSHKSNAESTIHSNKNTICKVLASYGINIESIQSYTGPIFDSYCLKFVSKSNSNIKKIYLSKADIVFCLSEIGKCDIIINEQDGSCTILVYKETENYICIKDVIDSEEFSNSSEELPLGLGIDIYNNAVIRDLTTMPNLLICGGQGQGKSVCLNTILTTLLFKKHPNELKLVLIDPKRIELSLYNAIMDKFGAATLDNEDEPILCNPKQIEETVKALLFLCEERQDKLIKAHARNIREYNNKYINYKLSLTDGHEFMPYIVVVIDSYEILCTNKDIETSLLGLLKQGYYVGIHTIISAQNISAKFLNHTQAGMPTKIAFRLATEQESKKYLGVSGAEELCQPGFMLLKDNNVTFVQGAFITTEETEHIVDFIERQPGPVMPQELPIEKGNIYDQETLDPFFEEAARLMVMTQQGSTIMLQRCLSVGYNRAGHIIDQLEKNGIVGPATDANPRDVLIKSVSQLNTLLGKLHQHR